MLMLSALIFFAVTVALIGAWLYWAPSQAETRLREIVRTDESSDWTEKVIKAMGPFARLSLPEGKWENSRLRLLFLNAGIRRADARVLYFGAKTLLPVALAMAALLLAQAGGTDGGLMLIFQVATAALVGCYLPNLLLYMARSARQEEIFLTFPDAADLMLVCVEAGLALDGALTKVADEIGRKSAALAEELHLTNLEMRAGGSRETALRNLALRTGVEEVSTFSSMLIQADKFGTSVGDSLRVFSDHLRHKRQVRAEERAAKIPTKLLIPLVGFIFPAIIGVILGPAVIMILRNLAPMLGGQT